MTPANSNNKTLPETCAASSEPGMLPMMPGSEDEARAPVDASALTDEALRRDPADDGERRADRRMHVFADRVDEERERHDRAAAARHAEGDPDDRTVNDIDEDVHAVRFVVRGRTRPPALISSCDARRRTRRGATA